eukprot:scaffold1702_cov128-Skeletonema_dohrnii-CCMP3373.AAC.3
MAAFLLEFRGQITTILYLMDQPMLSEVIKLLLIYCSIGGDAGSGWMFIARFVVVMLSYHCIDCCTSDAIIVLYVTRKMKDTSLRPLLANREQQSEQRGRRRPHDLITPSAHEPLYNPPNLKNRRNLFHHCSRHLLCSNNPNL